MSKGNLNLFIRFRLFKSRGKNGKLPIYVRFTINQKRVELSTNEYVAPIAWDAEGQFVKGKTEEAQTINSLTYVANIALVLCRWTDKALQLCDPINFSSIPWNTKRQQNKQ